MLKFTIDMISGKNCTFYIHDNLDPKRVDSIPCTIWPLNGQLDMATELISYRMVEITSEFKRNDKFDENEKRIRKESDEVCFIPSTTLNTFNDFKLLYECEKVVIPLNKSSDLDENNRKYEVFDHPRCLKLPHEFRNQMATVDRQVEHKPNLLDRIVKHFHLLKPHKSTFYCEPIYVIDPITILVVPFNASSTEINMGAKPTRNPLLTGLKLNIKH